LSDFSQGKLDDSAVKEFIKRISGEEAIEVVEELKERDEATDEEIAENVSSDLNYVRKVLYQLYNKGLAEYTRSRNSKTGWVTYTWWLELENADSALENEKEGIMEDLKERLKYEQNNMFYLCPDNHSKLTFEEASDINFECPECGKTLQHSENEKAIKELKNQIEMIRNDLENI